MALLDVIKKGRDLLTNKGQQLSDSVRRKNVRTPLKQFLWHCELPNDINDVSGNPIFDPTDTLEISSRILSITTPFFTLETEKASTGNSFWYYGKSIDISQITLEIMEYKDGKSFQYFNFWKNMVHNPNNTFNPPVFYKRNLVVYQMDDMKENVVKHTYKGFFVSTINELSRDYESNNVVKYSVSLTGDTVEYEVLELTQKIDSDKFLDLINTAKSIKKSIKDLLF